MADTIQELLQQLGEGGPGLGESSSGPDYGTGGGGTTYGESPKAPDLSGGGRTYGEKPSAPDYSQEGGATYGVKETPRTTKLPADEAIIGGKKYKFSAEDLNSANIEDVYTSAQDAPTQAQLQGTLDVGGRGFKNINPEKLTDKEYDTLTKEASKGNKLAQEILVKGKYKEQGYPTLQQDLSKYMDPFVKQLQGLPAMGQSLQTAQDLTMLPYDFTNAEGQVNKMLASTGVAQPPGVMANLTATSPQTQAYANQIGSIVGQSANEMNQAGPMGLPSIETALKGLGPAAKLSEGATPYEALLGALLSHQQYLDIYQGAFPSNQKGTPNWLSQLIASITGQTGAGNFGLAQLGAAGAGTLPGNTPQPPGTP